MKTSRYNRYVFINQSFYVYNLVSKAIFKLDNSETKTALENNDLDFFNTDILSLYSNQGIIYNENIDEALQIVRLQRVIKYGNKNARLTILPTLNCNFHCWYCYEQHNSQKMNTDQIDSITKFSQNLLQNNHLNSLTLDWFGGEPMLCFDTIVVPLSHKIKEKCERSKVPFYNMMTTNGYLFEKKHIKHLKEISLKQYQITLDGEKGIHNKTRYSTKQSDSFTKIINNVLLLISEINDIDMTVRINCTKENADTIVEIIDYFPPEYRHLIKISMQTVWQQIDELKTFSHKIDQATQEFEAAGFLIPAQNHFPPCPNICYVENMLQYTIGPDLNVYKCTARDFTDSINHIGIISEDGRFHSNDNILLYYQNSAFENETCMKCEFLPVCHTTCIQKHIEGEKIKCNKEYLKESVDSIVKRIIEERLKHQS